MTAKRYLETPRGRLVLVDASRAELEALGYGLWFEHVQDGKRYLAMSNYREARAVACEDPE